MLATIDGVNDRGGAGRALRSVAGTALADRFRCWSGRSGRRYTFSVFPFDPAAPDHGLLDFDGCVVVPVRRRGSSRGAEADAGGDAIGAYAIENNRDSRALLAAGVAAGVDEWHVHFLAADRAAREAAVHDLRGRLG